MKLKKCLLTENDCYKKATKITLKGIVVHSTGANNPNLKRYVQPDDGLLGLNKYNNHWNKPKVSKCVHAFIGKDKNGDVQVYQTLPFNYGAWGVGKGKKGSYNTSHIQFEICEDNLKDEIYFNNVFNLAAEFCAYLCKKYKLSVNTIVSHKEANKKGYASNHGDCDHWLKKFGKDMDWFRDKVEALLEPKEVEIKYVYNCETLNVRKGAGTKYEVVKEIKKGTKVNVYEISGSWARISTNEWVSNKYLTKTKPASYKAKIVSNCSVLNVRNGAGIKYKVVRTIKK
jgi:N-acetylmuramoyl-L-alanine amidase CwlA